MNVPNIFTPKNKYPMGILAVCLTLGPYLYINQTITGYRALPLTVIDQAIPFLPYTIWIYLSYFFIFVAAFVMEKDYKYLNKYMIAVMLINMTSDICFVLLPCYYDRSMVVLTDDLDSATRFLYQALYVLDEPTNCLPSLHVSAAYLASFLWMGRKPIRFAVFFTWATAISLSTMSTKQHYFVDVLTGLLLAFFWYRIVFKWWFKDSTDS